MPVLGLGDSDCEALRESWLGQPINSLSSLAYLVAGAAVARRRGPAGAAAALAASLLLVLLLLVVLVAPAALGGLLLGGRGRLRGPTLLGVPGRAVKP